MAGCVYAGDGRGLGTVSVDDGRERAEQVDAASRSRASKSCASTGPTPQRPSPDFRSRPAAKEHHVETRLAGFVVAALPMLSPKPGRAPEIAPIEVVTHDEGDTRRLRAFSARHGLYGAAIPLPERVGTDRTARRRRAIPRALDFEGAEAFFHIPRLAAPLPARRMRSSRSACRVAVRAREKSPSTVPG